MLDPATARLCVWRLPLEAAFRLFSKLGSLGGSIRERFSRTGRTRPALARPAFSRWLLENDRLRERWPCQWLNVLYFPFSETSPTSPPGSLGCLSSSSSASFADRFRSYWPRPASAGDFFNGLLDVLHVVSEVIKVTPSRSKPDRGMVSVRSETRNQHGDVLQVATVRIVVPRGPGASKAAPA